MIPVLPPAALGQEIAACTVLGASIGALRAVFPARGRAAFVPDLVWVGAVLAAVQSYAAPGAPAGRAAARPAEKGAQTTPQRKKNCKKAQKELAKPAPHDV